MLKLLNKYKVVFLLFLFGIILLFFIDKYWISPDEYLYVTLGRSIAATYNGNGCLYCIDTAHTPFLPFLISLGYYFFHIDSIIFYRIISIIFTIATLYILFRVFQIVFKNKKDAFLFFAIILLFPGFFTFVNKVNLDILALFFTAIVLYLLLKREKYWKISVALLLVFLSKDYTVVFSSIVISFIIFIDAFKEKNISLFKKIKLIVLNNIIVFVPLFLTVMVFMTTLLLPYPRMAENLFLEVFGNGYIEIASNVRNIFPVRKNAVITIGQTVVQPIAQPATESAVTIGQPTVQPVVVQTIVQPATQSAVIVWWDVFLSVVKLNLTDVFQGGTNFFEKIKLIYLSSYQEGDVNILVIPFLIVGLLSRIKVIYLSFKGKYNLIRKDLIFLLFFLVVLYFNYRVALGDHGFRIIFPLIIPFLYFIYWAFKRLIEKNNFWIKFMFGILSLLFICIYFYLNKGIVVYGSVISKNYFVAEFFKYKLYFNILLYLFFAGFVLFFSKLKIKWKHIFLLFLLIFMCAYKIFPFAVDKYFADKKYGNDYNLILARPCLEEIEKEDPIVLTNAKSYAYYYYANIIQLPNVDKPSLPVVREKPEIVYPNKLVPFDTFEKNVEVNFLCQNKIDYVFYVNTDSNQTMFGSQIHASELVTPIKEYFLPANNRFDWGLYKVNKKDCNK